MNILATKQIQAQEEGSNDKTTLERLIELAEEDETGETQYKLGVAYRNVDHQKSTQWFDASLNWGHAEGKFNYIKHCYHGIGKKQDIRLADRLLREFVKKVLREKQSQERLRLFNQYKKDLLKQNHEDK